MRVELYERMMTLQAGRRNFLKGAAALAAGTALSNSFVGTAFADDSIRKQILQIPGVGKGQPTDADFQKVGALVLEATKKNVAQGEFAGVELSFMG
ncbi:MAG: twin-arginine translocation signal domain-containing protein, partial [Devosia sp.]|nr:twin-arginine translocation signal domain-containing protein [Devosia sp.]